MAADDVKKALAKELNRLIQPVRDHFNNNKEAKELLAKVKKLNEEETARKKKLKEQPVQVQTFEDEQF